MKEKAYITGYLNDNGSQVVVKACHWSMPKLTREHVVYKRCVVLELVDGPFQPYRDPHTGERLGVYTSPAGEQYAVRPRA